MTMVEDLDQNVPREITIGDKKYLGYEFEGYANFVPPCLRDSDAAFAVKFDLMNSNTAGRFIGLDGQYFTPETATKPVPLAQGLKIRGVYTIQPYEQGNNPQVLAWEPLN